MQFLDDRIWWQLEWNANSEIVIRMYVETGGAHHTPHFHVYYQDQVGIYGIDRIECLAGSLPRRQERLVLAWGELHQEE